jgi:hypothetical protein
VEMLPVEFTLSTDHRGWARIQVQPPYGLFGDFLTSILPPSRMRDFRSMLAAYSADPTQYAYYAHDYTELEFEPSDGVVGLVIEHPDEMRKCEMPMAEFVQLAERWLAFAEVHPITLSNKPSEQQPADG